MQDIFQFNLAPSKSKIETELEAERNDSLIYAIMLLIFALVVYGVLVISQLLVLGPRVASAAQAVTARDGQVASFSGIRSQYGELFVKGLTLEPVLEKDLDPAQIFQVSDSIMSFDTRMAIISYSREASGIFVFEMLAPDTSLTDGLLKFLPSVEGVSDVFLRSVEVGSDSGVARIIIELNINAGG